MLEKEIQAKIIKYLKTQYPSAIVYKMTEETNCGIPDILFIYAGNVVFLEVKRPGGRIRPLQRVVVDRMVQQGCLAAFVHSVEEVKLYLSKNSIDFFNKL